VSLLDDLSSSSERDGVLRDVPGDRGSRRYDRAAADLEGGDQGGVRAHKGIVANDRGAFGGTVEVAGDGACPDVGTRPHLRQRTLALLSCLQ
jgi:hypothetical protein